MPAKGARRRTPRNRTTITSTTAQGAQDEMRRLIAEMDGDDSAEEQVPLLDVKSSLLKQRQRVGKGRSSGSGSGSASDSDAESASSSASSASSSSSAAAAPLDLNATAASLMAEHTAASMSPAIESALDLLIWSIPFSSLFVLLDIMIQQQYAMHPTLLQELGRMLGTVPILMGIIWWTTIRPLLPPLPLQLLLFLSSITCGCTFLWTFHEAPWLDVMRRTPPLGTLWIYAIVKLDLLPCVLSVAAVGGFIWWNDLPILSHKI